MDSDRLLELVHWLSRRTDANLRAEHVDDYAALALKHRVVGRVIERALSSDDQRDHGRLLEKLQPEFLRIVLQYRNRQAAASSFFASLPAQVTELLVLKGTNLFQINRNPFLLRASDDTDVLLAEPVSAHTLFAIAGVEERKVPVSHEEVNLIYRGFKYDFHKHFPVWRDNQAAVDVETIGDAGITQHESSLEIRAMPFGALRRGALVGKERAVPRPLYPGPAAGAFVQIVHFYRDLIRLFVGWTYFRSRITVQEIQDIADFVKDEDFDSGAFRALVREYRAESQARLAGSYVQALLNDPGLLRVLGEEPLFLDPTTPTEFAANIWYGFAFKFRVPPLRLLSDPFAAPDAIRLLKPNRVSARSGAPTKIDLSTPGIRLHRNGSVAQFELDLRVTGTVRIGLSFEAGHLEAVATEPANFNAFVSWGTSCFHCDPENADTRRRTTLSESLELRELTHTHEGRHRHTLQLEFRPLKMTEHDPVPLAIGLGLLQENGNLLSGILIAFEISQKG